MRPIPTTWSEPPWDAPLDADAVVAAISSTATISGLFLGAVADMAKHRGVTLPSARESYVGFRPYLLREHARLMVEAAHAVWPKSPLREGLRRMGRGSPGALVQSMIGRVVLGSAEGPIEILRAMAKSYALHTKPAAIEVLEARPGRAILRATDVVYFLDSHHVGVFEGVLRYAEVEDARVQLHSYGVSEADLLCEWRGR
jgi:uncharacterized protein (TIGR02265 family)